mmetsp:Transcript_6070/g.14801  ORF Transcript_6070/g.14801 Transcript_6070/m.14801 type:complete len:246 (-) Transcript_6070:8122-8859(-)
MFVRDTNRGFDVSQMFENFPSLLSVCVLKRVQPLKGLTNPCLFGIPVKGPINNISLRLTKITKIIGKVMQILLHQPLEPLLQGSPRKTEMRHVKRHPWVKCLDRYVAQQARRVVQSVCGGGNFRDFLVPTLVPTPIPIPISRFLGEKTNKGSIPRRNEKPRVGKQVFPYLGGGMSVLLGLSESLFEERYVMCVCKKGQGVPLRRWIRTGVPCSPSGNSGGRDLWRMTKHLPNDRENLLDHWSPVA